MALPKLHDFQIDWVAQQVAKYIENQRETYIGKASPLDGNQKGVVHPFFQESVLNCTRVVVLVDQRVSNPGFYGDLVKMGFELALLPNFSEMSAITFVDTVVFHQPIENRVLFHELVHVVQYDKLGVVEFAAKYVKGFLSGGSYRAIPLERNAYELDERFHAAPANVFSVEDEVQEWVDFELF